MIKAIFFDLDGTLVQTEVLKARSYAEAIAELSENTILQEEVLQQFEHLVGLSRMEVVKGLVNKFKSKLIAHVGVDSSDEAMGGKILSLRLERYHKILSDTRLLARHFCPFNLGLLKALKKDGHTVAIATMSHLKEAKTVVGSMGIIDEIDFFITKDQVLHGKPNPEIYLRAMDHFKLKPEECLVIEDSVQGVLAAINAEIPVFAVTNDITRKSIHKSSLLPEAFIVDDLTGLHKRVYDYIETQNSEADVIMASES